MYCRTLRKSKTQTQTVNPRSLHRARQQCESATNLSFDPKNGNQCNSTNLKTLSIVLKKIEITYGENDFRLFIDSLSLKCTAKKTLIKHQGNIIQKPRFFTPNSTAFDLSFRNFCKTFSLHRRRNMAQPQFQFPKKKKPLNGSPYGMQVISKRAFRG